MKTASKVFLIIGIVCSFIAIFASLLFVIFTLIVTRLPSFNDAIQKVCTNNPEISQLDCELIFENIFGLSALISGFSSIVWGVVTIVVAGLTLKAIATKTNSRELIVYGVLSLLLVNLLAGIFTLCIETKDLECNKLEISPKKPEEKPDVEIQTEKVETEVVDK